MLQQPQNHIIDQHGTPMLIQVQSLEHYVHLNIIQ
jgi:hypothetical protein